MIKAAVLVSAAACAVRRSRRATNFLRDMLDRGQGVYSFMMHRNISIKILDLKKIKIKKRF